MTATETPAVKDRPWEIVGSRITVYHVLQELLLPDWTESRIAEFYRIDIEQVAAARAYLFANFDEVMARHSEIERTRTEQMEAQRASWSTTPTPLVCDLFADWTRARNLSATPELFPPFVEWALAIRSSAGLVGSR